MPDDPRRHGRRTIRLRGYDYALAGAYYVTICAERRGEVFGTGAGGQVILSEPGRMVCDWWLALPSRFAGVGLGSWVVM
ncbi:transposase, partial [Oscillochloris sp. ZM17-4]|nr:transposase [Oscillochloris sp. ZM17-4]